MCLFSLSTRELARAFSCRRRKFMIGIFSLYTRMMRLIRIIMIKGMIVVFRNASADQIV